MIRKISTYQSLEHHYKKKMINMALPHSSSDLGSIEQMSLGISMDLQVDINSTSVQVLRDFSSHDLDHIVLRLPYLRDALVACFGLKFGLCPRHGRVAYRTCIILPAELSAARDLLKPLNSSSRHRHRTPFTASGSISNSPRCGGDNVAPFFSKLSNTK